MDRLLHSLLFISFFFLLFDKIYEKIITRLIMANHFIFFFHLPHITSTKHHPCNNQ